MSQCIDCGGLARPKRGSVGVSFKRCIECQKKFISYLNRNNRINNIVKIKQYDKDRSKFPRAKWSTLKSNAKRRGYELTLTFEQFVEINGKICFYCDGRSGYKDEAGTRLDRLNNSRGYTLDNVVPCCSFCNKIKQNLLTPDETKIAVKAILDHRSNNGQ